MMESDLQTFEAVGALIVALDVDHRIAYWNGACSDLTGYSFDEVRGRRIWDFLLVPEEMDSVKALLTGVREMEHPRRFANHWLTKVGDRRWIAWSKTLTRHPDGRVQYILKTGIDRTEAKCRENALRTSEARFRRLIAIAADAIISVDRNQRIVTYNEAAEKIFGWSAAEVMGKSLDILLPSCFHRAHSQHVRWFGTAAVRARPMGERIHEIFGQRKNGQVFPAHAAISKLEVNGHLLFTAVLRDVTEQEQREREREILARLGSVLVSTLDCDVMLTSVARVVVENFANCCVIDLVDRDGNLRRVKVIHRDPVKMALCKRLERIPIDSRHRHLLSSALESKKPSLIPKVPPQYHEGTARSDEHLRTLQELAPRSLMIVPLLARGNLLGVLTFISSYPSRRYREEDLQLAEEFAFRAALAIENARLYENTRRHADDLREANEQMVSAIIRARESMEAAEAARMRAEKGERELRQVAEFREMFIGILGHDLRNPLGTISMAVSMLRQSGHLHEQDEKAVSRIVNSLERMRRMISQLLDLTRARLGAGFPLERKPTDLRDICQSVVEEFAAPIHLGFDGDLMGTWDSDRLAEALSNIVGNAIEHGARGTPIVVKASAAGAQVVVEICNQGDPIPPDLLPCMFEPFRRAKQHEKSPTGNLGLGLYIAHQIALSHGGTLEARSSGGTTTFVMRLPRRDRAEPRSTST